MSLIKSFDVDLGDMFYIVHRSDNFTILDCNMVEENREKITDELIQKASNKSICRFISTHPDDDHFHGLKYLDDRMQILNFYCVKNDTTKEDETEDFERYCELRDSSKAFYLFARCQRCWMNKNDNEKNYGSSGIEILWPDTSNEDYRKELSNAHDGKSPNNISPIIQYSLEDSATVMWFGDLESSFMEKIKDQVVLPHANIVFAPHHGRKSGRIPNIWLDALNPELIIIGHANSDDIDYTYSDYAKTITQNSAGDIVLNCGSHIVDIYVSNRNYQVDFLLDENKSDQFGCKYLGTLKV